MTSAARARRSPPSKAQLFLWSLDVHQKEIAAAVDRTDRSVTAMLRGEVRLLPEVAKYIADRFDYETAAKVERMCRQEFEANPKRPKNRKRKSRRRVSA